MKKRIAAGLLLLISVVGCAAAPLQEEAFGQIAEIPAETTTMNMEETTEPIGNKSKHELLQEQASAAVHAAVNLRLPLRISSEPASETVQPDAAVEEERTLYAAGFFYEPLSSEVRQRIYGLSYKEDCTIPYEQLRYVSVQYVDFEGITRTGEIICNKAIAQDMAEIFYELYQASYPIEKILLIDEYNADDDLSCLDNNTSCFNYRVVSGSGNLSKHAMGLAIDINPFYNPYVTYPNGEQRISPPGSEPYADRSQDFPYKIDENDLCYQLFISHGFTWGGHWKTLKDYQHFQKSI